MKFNNDIFINKAKLIHDNKYNYSLVDYINARTKVKIICPIHGVFEQKPYHHLNKNGCRKCSNENSRNKQSFTKEKFIEKSKKIFDNEYDYSLVNYINANTKVLLICKKHGIFEIKPNFHLNCYEGCPKCKKNKNFNKNKITFIEKSNNKYGNKYDYSLVEYNGSVIKVKIICPIHGIFEQIPHDHLRIEHGCPKCADIIKRIKRIKQMEKDKFNGNQMIPSYNKLACELFDNISEEYGIHIQHAMNGGEFFIKDLGYWLDGYDKENNVVYEYDEKYHFDKKGNLKEKDIIRQDEIIYFLKCKFIRIKEQNNNEI